MVNFWFATSTANIQDDRFHGPVWSIIRIHSPQSILARLFLALFKTKKGISRVTKRIPSSFVVALILENKPKKEGKYGLIYTLFSESEGPLMGTWITHACAVYLK